MRMIPIDLELLSKLFHMVFFTLEQYRLDLATCDYWVDLLDYRYSSPLYYRYSKYVGYRYSRQAAELYHPFLIL